MTEKLLKVTLNPNKQQQSQSDGHSVNLTYTQTNASVLYWSLGLGRVPEVGVGKSNYPGPNLLAVTPRLIREYKDKKKPM